MSVKALALSILQKEKGVPNGVQPLVSVGLPVGQPKPLAHEPCWHCDGVKICGCSSCYQGLGGPGPCRACKGVGLIAHGEAIQ